MLSSFWSIFFENLNKRVLLTIKVRLNPICQLVKQSSVSILLYLSPWIPVVEWRKPQVLIFFRYRIIEKTVIPTDFFGPDTYDSVPAMGLLSISEIKVYDRKVSLKLETVQMLKLAEDILKLEENSSTFLKKLNIVFTHFQKLGNLPLLSVDINPISVFCAMKTLVVLDITGTRCIKNRQINKGSSLYITIWY